MGRVARAALSGHTTMKRVGINRELIVDPAEDGKGIASKLLAILAGTAWGHSGRWHEGQSGEIDQVVTGRESTTRAQATIVRQRTMTGART